MSNLPELPEDYWDRQAKQCKALDKLRKIIGLREKGLKPPKGFKGW